MCCSSLSTSSYGDDVAIVDVEWRGVRSLTVHRRTVDLPLWAMRACSKYYGIIDHVQRDYRVYRNFQQLKLKKFVLSA